MAALSLTALYQPVEQGWTQARLVEVPGVIAIGRTREQARAALVDALEQFLKAHALRPALDDTPSADWEELRLVLSR